MNGETTYSRSLLQKELARRMRGNPRYSLRAFAKAMGVSHTVLSLVMSGKRRIPKKSGLKMTKALGLNPDEAKKFLSPNVEAALGTRSSAEYEQLELDFFEIIADWYHFAILSLLEIRGAKFEARWIARRLGISEVEADLAIQRLQRVQLVAFERGRWRQSKKPLKVENKISTTATRRCHRGILERAVLSLDNDPIEIRDFSGITFAMDPAHVPHALERIRRFRRELTAELEEMSVPQEVYQLSVQIFPLSRTQEIK